MFQMTNVYCNFASGRCYPSRVRTLTNYYCQTPNSSSFQMCRKNVWLCHLLHDSQGVMPMPSGGLSPQVFLYNHLNFGELGVCLGVSGDWGGCIRRPRWHGWKWGLTCLTDIQGFIQSGSESLAALELNISFFVIGLPGYCYYVLHVLNNIC